jgi:HNH endonuclease
MPKTKTPTYRCQCGCGRRIPPKVGHRYRPPRYILSHYLKLGTSSRIVALRAAKLKTRLTPPPDWPKPSGLCACGCGERTRIASVSKPERGEYIGYPQRYKHGHYSRLALSQRGANHPNWSGGRYLARDGYVLIYRPDSPSAQKSGYVPEHREIYETTRGVTLPSSVHVHHINGIRDDNRPENLIATTRGEHMRMHIKAGEWTAALIDLRLRAAVVAHITQHGQLPDLEALTARLYAA